MRTFGWVCAMLILASGLISSCRKEKEKVYKITGRLLASNTNRVPVSNYTIDFYQRGAAGIPFPAYTSSASATATTDGSGFFSLDFRAGKSSFLFLNGYNSNPISMEGRANASFPYFTLGSIHTPGDLGDVYLYKKIDTLIIALASPHGVAATDTLNINYYTLNGFHQKVKKGVVVNPGATNAIIDTLLNTIFMNFDYESRKYGNQVSVLQRGLSLQYGFNYADYSNPFDPGDEKKRIITLQ